MGRLKVRAVGTVQAFVTKIKYGIGVSDSQPAIKEALGPILDNLLREIRKIIRYYEDRISGGQRKVAQVVILGGGATMPGFNQFLSSELKLPIKTLDPWHYINLGDLRPPVDSERAIYTTVVGAALLDPKGALV